MAEALPRSSRDHVIRNSNSLGWSWEYILDRRFTVNPELYSASISAIGIEGVTQIVKELIEEGTNG